MLQLILIIAGVLLLDQGSKMVIQSMMRNGESLPVILGIFHITFIRNSGAAFGILANQTTIFVVVTSLVVLVTLIFYRYISPEWKLLRIGLAMFLGGALGNLLDRVRIGSVVDFLDFRIWPVFNVADTFVVIGVLLLCWELFRSPVETNNGQKVR